MRYLLRRLATASVFEHRSHSEHCTGRGLPKEAKFTAFALISRAIFLISPSFLHELQAKTTLTPVGLPIAPPLLKHCASATAVFDNSSSTKMIQLLDAIITTYRDISLARRSRLTDSNQTMVLLNKRVKITLCSDFRSPGAGHCRDLMLKRAFP